jgi:hypothetical protein
VLQGSRIRQLVWIGALCALVTWLAIQAVGRASASMAAQCVSEGSSAAPNGAWLENARARHRVGVSVARKAQAAPLHVTWSGFRTVTFEETLVDAAKALHGRVTCSKLPTESCGVTYPGDLSVSVSGSLRWTGSKGNSFPLRTGRTVGSFQSFSGGKRPVRYPRGTFVGQSLAHFKRALGSRARRERPEHNAAVGYYLVGPHGRTLWGWGDSRTGIIAIGLAESLAGAKFDWQFEG